MGRWIRVGLCAAMAALTACGGTSEHESPYRAGSGSFRPEVGAPRCTDGISSSTCYGSEGATTCTYGATAATCYGPHGRVRCSYGLSKAHCEGGDDKVCVVNRSVVPCEDQRGR